MSNPDTEYNNYAESAIIADLENVDQLKAALALAKSELAAWRKGPWVLKRFHEAELAKMQVAEKPDAGVEWEARRAAVQAVKEVAS